eukprot:g4262.t1
MEDIEDTRKDNDASSGRPAAVVEEQRISKKVKTPAWLRRKRGERVDDEVVRFLKSGERRMRGGTVALASYPRSGNSMIRGLLELATKIITGSDVKPTRKLSKELAAAGFRGEGVVGRAWIVKTHYPERLGWKEFDASKVIVLVRNPFDAIDSHFNMILTRTHTHSIDESEYERFRAYWEAHVLEECSMWCRFHQYWLRRAREGVPIIFVRYERLLQHRGMEVDRLLRFLCGDDDEFFSRCVGRLKGAIPSVHVAPTSAPAGPVHSTLERTELVKSAENDSFVEPKPRSNATVEVDTKRDTLVVERKGQGTYQPRSGGIGKSLHHYSNGLRKRIFSQEAHLGTFLRLFGYDRILECGASLEDNAASKCGLPYTARRDIGMRCVVEVPAYDPKTCLKTEQVAKLSMTEGDILPIATPDKTTRPSCASATQTRASLPLRINDPKALLRKCGQSDPFARGVRWARVLHKAGVRIAPKKKREEEK